MEEVWALGHVMYSNDLCKMARHISAAKVMFDKHMPAQAKYDREMINNRIVRMYARGDADIELLPIGNGKIQKANSFTFILMQM